MRRKLKPTCVLALFLAAGISAASGEWSLQQSGVTARFRGVSAVSPLVAWASGTAGTVARTIDGGKTWQSASVSGAEKLDFRDIQAIDENTAFVLSIGEGEASRIYKTVDGGKSWTLQFLNHDSKAFYDAFAFWDAEHGIALGDPVDGRFLLLVTDDGGVNWKGLHPARIPETLPGEAAFAASGTCIAVQRPSSVWFATGGGAQARVFRSGDRGLSWEVSATPITAGLSSSGIFSIAFLDSKNGVVVGGDYKKEGEPSDNAAITSDGGETWTLAKAPLPGYRSGVAMAKDKLGSFLVAVGPLGSDMSRDRGLHWKSLGSPGFHAVSFSADGVAGWAAGESGRIAKYSSTGQ